MPGLPRTHTPPEAALASEIPFGARAHMAPREIEQGIDGYLTAQALLKAGRDTPPPQASTTAPSLRQ
jgi:hypothetical protein